jgi:hypothetical protein
MFSGLMSPVDDPRVVDGGQAAEGHDDDLEELPVGDGDPPLVAVREALPLEELHDHVGLQIAVDPEVEDVHHVAVPQGGRDLRLLEEPHRQLLAARATTASRNFTATGRPSVVWEAFQTVAMPPRPIGVSNRYFSPMMMPGWSTRVPIPMYGGLAGAPEG